MEPRIEILKPKRLVGISMEMSLVDNKTQELWQKFMPRRGEVKNRASTEYISMQIYGNNWAFSPDALFKKWATVEVSSYSEIPADMEKYLLDGGQYAIFVHLGPANTASNTMQYIFGDWLPKSGYSLDNREHFEILPEGYNLMDPEATEEIWVPIRK